MTENELDNLEAWLDGELGPTESVELQKRLATDPGLSGALSDLRQERELRGAFFAAIEPDESRNRDFLNRCEGVIARRRRWELYRGFARTAGAIAACVLVGFGIGRVGRDGASRSGGALSPSPVYQVNISDEAGRFIGVQRFDSPEQAREFSEDLYRWQEQQEQIRSGYIVVRSRDF